MKKRFVKNNSDGIIMPMVTLKTMPKDTAIELLRYLAENESLLSLEKLYGSDLAPEEAKAMLRELAGELSKELAGEKQKVDIKGSKVISDKAKKIISCLSPREEKELLTAFGIIEKP